MEGGALFNPGFLGGTFLWWVGQIADDSTWRDNVSSSIHKSKDSIPGWGRRYKVRIIGLHDQGETVIPSSQLPWAQIMYPVTAGGGQANSGQTSNLRQGMMVFGFFLDGQDQQVPVIMGVLGNNSQTALSTKIGTDRVTNEKPGSLATSGFAEGQKPKSGETKEKVPDFGKEVEKPKGASAPPTKPKIGVKLDQFGRDPRTPTRREFAAAQSARAEADRLGITGAEKEARIARATVAATKEEAQELESPASPTKPGATIEQVDSVHKLNAAHVKREDKLREKIPLMKPDDKVGNALKNIQTIIDNITQKINKYISAINSYIDAVSSTINDLKKLIADAACEIAKYIKLILDQVMEYVLSKLNCVLKKVVSAMPLSMRSLFGDMKEIITELILCLYNKITANVCGLIEGLLNKALNPDQLEQTARQQQGTGQQGTGQQGTGQQRTGQEDKPSSPQVPMCYAEDLTASIIYTYKQDIDDANNSILNNINAFLDDMQNELAGVSGALGDITASIGNIGGSISSALSFESLKLNIFGCELKPNLAVADFYTFASGGASQPESQLPNPKNVEDSVNNNTETATATEQSSFVEPSKATPNVDLKGEGARAVRSERDLVDSGDVRPVGPDGRQNVLQL